MARTFEVPARETNANVANGAGQQEADAPRDFRSRMRIGLLVILFAFGGFFVWAIFAPLDEGVHSPGTLIVDSKRKTVQNASAGVVKEIHVREGDLVKVDQLLITMDPVQARSQREIAESGLMAARISEARLLAEQLALTSIAFPADVLSRAGQPQVALLIRSQTQLFHARQAALNSELDGYRESIAGLEAQVAGLRSVQFERALQIESLTKELARLSPLVEEGFFAINRFEEIKRQLSNNQGVFADGSATISRISNQIAETKLRIIQRQQEFRKEVETQLSEVSKDAKMQAERLVALEDELRRTEIRSPVEGAVVGLAVTTVGAVLAAATRTMDIIPVDERMIIEAQVQPHLIERIQAGIPAKLMFTALNPRTTPIVDGRLISISADLLQTQQGVPYYLARIEVPKDSLSLLGDVKLHAGMPVDVILVTGERSFLNYLFKPISDRMARGLKER